MENKKRRTTTTHFEQQQQQDEEEEEEEDEDPQPKTKIENLPIEIIHDILSKLPISSLVQFKSVCRAWRVLTQDPNFINHHFLSTQNDPCLIFHCDFPIRNHLYFVDFAAAGEKSVKKLNTPFSPKMPEFDLVASCNGLLCLSDSLYNDSIYIYNPFNSNYLELPKSLNFTDQEAVFGFGFHLQNYKVVKIIYYRNAAAACGGGGYPRPRRLIYPQSEVQIFTLGTSDWRSLGKISYQLVRRPAEALVNGRLHWVTRPQRYNPLRRIISFDLGDEEFREVPKPECGGLSRCNYHLVVLKGRLSAAVYCNYGRLEIWVMKEYNVKESWVKRYSIGSYVLPKSVKESGDRGQFNKIWRNCLDGKIVRVLGSLKNGEILLEYKNRIVVSYDPNIGIFKDVVLQGKPKWFHTIVHFGSLNWIHTSSIHT